MVKLTPEIVFKLTAQPKLYEGVAFLSPMKNSALAVHKRIPKRRCSKCLQRSIKNFSRQLSGAFTALIVKEHAKENNGLAALKKVMSEILNMPIDEVHVNYADKAGKDSLLIF